MSAAFVLTANGKRVCNLSGRIDEPDVEDAHLIAAAPDLYAALEALLNETELTYATMLRDKQDIARSALAKARGGA